MNRRYFCNNLILGFGGALLVPGENSLFQKTHDLQKLVDINYVEKYQSYFNSSKNFNNPLIKKGEQLVLKDRADIQTYLFVINNWTKEEKHFLLNVAQKRSPNPLNAPRKDLFLRYDNLNQNNYIKAKKMQSTLRSHGVNFHLIGENSYDFWSSWRNKTGVFLMDWIGSSNSDLIAALGSCHPCSKFHFDGAKIESNNIKLFMEKFHSISARVIV